MAPHRGRAPVSRVSHGHTTLLGRTPRTVLPPTSGLRPGFEHPEPPHSHSRPPRSPRPCHSARTAPFASCTARRCTPCAPWPAAPPAA
eukprot:7390744-Prymnesium_polylepis.2